MRSIIGLVAVLALASGLIGAFAVNELPGNAGAAPPPPVQDVNVVSQPSAQGRLITLSMSPYSGGSTSSSEPIDVADCDLISIMSRGGRVGTIQRASLDGSY